MNSAEILRAAALPKIEFIFAWYGLWVGVLWDQKKRQLYILPVPCLGVVIDFAPPQPEVVAALRGAADMWEAGQ